MTIPERYKNPIIAVLVALIALFGVVIVDLEGDDTPTTTTAAPTSTTTTDAPTTTTTTAPPGEGFVDIPSNFDVGTYLRNDSLPQSSANEPSGNFRTICRASHLDWADPIVNPGAVSNHLHLFFGNDAVDADTTYPTLRTEGGSTCEGGPLNRTGYWMPAVFSGATGEVVPPDLILVYYKSTDDNVAGVTDVQPFPNGLRMIAGSNNGNGEHMQWKCVDDSQSGDTIPTSCPDDYVIAIVTFPACWNGTDLDSPDHRSHMAYRQPTPNGWGCPASHPIHVPEVTENFHWTGSGSDVGTWYLSSDVAGMITPAPRGSTLHADWFGGWDNTIQTRWVNNCLIGMFSANNGNLCDGQSLSGSTGGIGPVRQSGWTPTAGG